MAKNTAAVSQEATGEEKISPATNDTPQPEKAVETILVEYTAQELINAGPAAFGVPQECVSAALKMAGITSATEEEAKKLIDKFMKQEVKK